MINERVREARNALGLSMAEFGARFGVSIDVVKNIEYARANTSDLTLNHMCEIHHINRHWLETGEGEMFDRKNQPDETAKLIESVTDSPAMRSLLATWAQLSDENKAVFEKFAAAYVEDYNQRMAADKIAQAEALIDEAAAEPDVEQKQA